MFQAAMIESNGGRPGDTRGFVHKKLLGGLSKLAGVVPIPGAGLVSSIAGSLAGRPSVMTTAQKNFGKQVKLQSLNIPSIPDINIPSGLGCVWPWRKDPVTEKCTIWVGDRPGPNGNGEMMGEAVMGRYGAGLRPGSMVIDRATCGRGMQLGNDGLCYNKSQITNKQRMWPAGRKPLLTGGDMRAISIASRAGTRLERTTKRLQRMGMMKKPAARSAGRRAQHHHHPAA